VSEWALTYDGYRRLASAHEKLEKLLRSALNSYAGRGRVPDRCGVDILRGWAVLLSGQRQENPQRPSRPWGFNSVSEGRLGT
jgi:hypothetical protein